MRARLARTRFSNPIGYHFFDVIGCSKVHTGPTRGMNSTLNGLSAFAFLIAIMAYADLPFT